MKHKKMLIVIILFLLILISWSIYKYTKITLLVIGAVIGIPIALVITIIIIALIGLAIKRVLRNKYLTQLRSNDEDLRIKGAQSLVKMNSIETIDDLSEAVQVEKSTKVRKALIDVLYAMSEKYRKQKKPEVEDESLGEVKSDRQAVMTIDLPAYKAALEEYIIPPLKEALHSQDQEEKEAAIMALVWIGTRSALDTIEKSGIAVSLPEIMSQTRKDIQFTAYYPTTVNEFESNSVYVYAYITEMLHHVHREIIKSKGEFGNDIPISKKAEQSIRLIKNTPITVFFESEDEFFPSQSVTTKWNGEWIKFAFHFRLTEQQKIKEKEELNFRISIRIYSIEIAFIELSIRVNNKIQNVKKPNPLVLAKYSSNTFLPYSKIFVSYSRKDNKVVKIYRHAQQAIGNDVFVDTYSIRAGENWKAALANAIDTADIFQLFWSQHSAKSTSVKDEWDYALIYRCPLDRCENFIRPVYWTIPIPAEPPEELKHLNFKYVPLDEK